MTTSNMLRVGAAGGAALALVGLATIGASANSHQAAAPANAAPKTITLTISFQDPDVAELIKAQIAEEQAEQAAEAAAAAAELQAELAAAAAAAAQQQALLTAAQTTPATDTDTETETEDADAADTERDSDDQKPAATAQTAKPTVFRVESNSSNGRSHEGHDR